MQNTHTNNRRRPLQQNTWVTIVISKWYNYSVWLSFEALFFTFLRRASGERSLPASSTWNCWPGITFFLLLVSFFHCSWISCLLPDNFWVTTALDSSNKVQYFRIIIKINIITKSAKFCKYWPGIFWEERGNAQQKMHDDRNQPILTQVT